MKKLFNISDRYVPVMLVTLGWSRYVGDSGVSIGLDRFGASAPASVLYREFGFTADDVQTPFEDNVIADVQSRRRREGAVSHRRPSGRPISLARGDVGGSKED